MSSKSTTGRTPHTDPSGDTVIQDEQAREHDPDIEDVCVARCFACSQLWCPDCGELFKDDRSTVHDCPAWEDMDFDDDDLNKAD